MFASVLTGTIQGIDALPVTIEVDESPGLPILELVGLPAGAVRESRVRVRAALRSCKLSLPHRRFVVNLAPGDLPKTGSSFDLAMAAALLMVRGGPVKPERLKDVLVLGELSIGGDVRAVRGVLAQLRSAHRRGVRRALVPYANRHEAVLVEGMEVLLARHLSEVAHFLFDGGELPVASQAAHAEAPHAGVGLGDVGPDLRDVCDQFSARRALEIAACGRHHILFVGPPGSGKSMLAERLVGVLPPPTPNEVLDIATIHSTVGFLEAPILRARPFRAPHHGASVAAMVGGGDPIVPGEITRAHRGVLFLDELPEFRRDAIEALRTTMESRSVTVVRVKDRVTMPADALVVAAMNPCPCGFFGDPQRVCRCAPDRVERYMARVSGPLLDRFDLHVEVPRLKASALRRGSDGEASAVVRARVLAGRRFREFRVKDAGSRDVAEPTRSFLAHAIDRTGLSARAYHKVLCVARTIADLARANEVQKEHVIEALQYRRLDRRDPTLESPVLTA